MVLLLLLLVAGRNVVQLIFQMGKTLVPVVGKPRDQSRRWRSRRMLLEMMLLVPLLEIVIDSAVDGGYGY